MIILEIPRSPENPLLQASLINIKLFDLYEQLQAESTDQSNKDFYSFMCVIFAHIGLCLTHDSAEKLNELLFFISKESQKTQIKGNETIN